MKLKYSLIVFYFLASIIRSKITLAEHSKEEKEKLFSELYDDMKNFDFGNTYVKYLTMPKLSHHLNRSLDKTTDVEVIASETGQNNGSLSDLIDKNISHLQQISSDVLPNDAPYLNPGLGATININLLNEIQQTFVEKLYLQFKEFDLPMEISADFLDLSKLHISLDNLESKNLIFFLSPSDNSIVLTFSDLSMRLAGNIRVHKAFFSSSGTIKVGFTLKSLVAKITFVKLEDSSLVKPTISAQIIDLDIPEDELKISLDLKYIPDFIMDMVIYFIKGTLIKTLTNFVGDFAKGDGSKQVNEMINQQYPEEVEIWGVMVGSLLTDKVIVQQNNLFLSIDGIAYVKDQKPEKRMKVSSMQFSKDDRSSLMTEISQEMLESALKSFIKGEYNNEYTFIAQKLKIKATSNVSTNTITIDSSGIEINNLLVNIDAEFLNFYIKCSFYLDMGVRVNYLDFKNDIANISISKIKVNEYSFDSNLPVLNAFGIYLKKFIETFGVLVIGYNLNIPHVKLPFDFEVSKIMFEMKDKFMVIKTDVEFVKNNFLSS